MKKIAIILALIATLPAGVVYAQESNMGTGVKPPLRKIEPKIIEQKNKIDAKVEAVKEKITLVKEKIADKASTTKAKIETKLDARKEKLEERASTTKAKIEARLDARKQKILSAAEKTAKIMTAAVERIAKLALRTEERLTILSDKGVVKAETKTIVQNKLSEARKAIEDAKASIANIVSETQTALDSQNEKGGFVNVRKISDESKDLIKVAQQKVVDAVSAIKARLPKADKATTTEATSQN